MFGDALRYWAPKLRFLYRANRDFWGPRLRFVARANKSFWLPRLRFVLQANKEFWIPRIERQYLPFVRKRYRFYYLHYGRGWARKYRRAMAQLKPMWAYPRYLMRQTWRLVPPSSRRSIQRVPAPLKKAMDRYMSWSLRNLSKTLPRRGTPPKLKAHLQQLARAMVPSRDRRFQRRLRRALLRIRRFAEDRAMVSCYRVVALQSAVVNAFNTGCTNYITSALAAKLSDLELTAVLAHEISHGDQGHAVKNIGLIAQSAGQHAYRLIAEEIEWFLTGKTGPVLQGVMRRGNIVSILKVYGKQAPAVEIAADRGATRILLRAGISPKHLVSALFKLHGKRPSQKLSKDAKNFTDSIRHYPSLHRRVKAVIAQWKPRRGR